MASITQYKTGIKAKQHFNVCVCVCVCIWECNVFIHI